MATPDGARGGWGGTMGELVIAVFALVVIGYILASRRLDRANVSAPMVFAIVGALLVWGDAPGLADPAAIRTVAEATLAMILFHDAAHVRPSELMRDRGPLLRLLFIGLPLTILLGWGIAYVLFGVGVWVALFIASALAPTDAGLGAATVLNPVVPERIRRILNGESGLNDGLATPVVLFALAAASAGVKPEHALVEAVVEIVIATVVGAVVGYGIGRLLRAASARGWADKPLLPLAVLALPLVAYFAATVVHGNGFIAAYLAGTAFAATRPQGDEHVLVATESVSSLLSYAVWFLFGVLFVSHLGDYLSWQAVLFAILALTVLRMGPVWLALAGTGFRPPTKLFIGWFGPRGLATVVFSLIAIEEVSGNPLDPRAIGVLGLTVLFSVIAHGVSAAPWSRTFGAWVSRTQPAEEQAA